MIGPTTVPLAEAVVGLTAGLAFYLLLKNAWTRYLTLLALAATLLFYSQRAHCTDVRCLFEYLIAQVSEFLEIGAAHPITMTAYPAGVYMAKRLLDRTTPSLKS